MNQSRSKLMFKSNYHTKCHELRDGDESQIKFMLTKYVQVLTEKGCRSKDVEIQEVPL